MKAQLVLISLRGLDKFKRQSPDWKFWIQHLLDWLWEDPTLTHLDLIDAFVSNTTDFGFESTTYQEISAYYRHCLKDIVDELKDRMAQEIDSAVLMTHPFAKHTQLVLSEIELSNAIGVRIHAYKDELS